MSNRPAIVFPLYHLRIGQNGSRFECFVDSKTYYEKVKAFTESGLPFTIVIESNTGIDSILLNPMNGGMTESVHVAVGKDGVSVFQNVYVHPSNPGIPMPEQSDGTIPANPASFPTLIGIVELAPFAKRLAESLGFEVSDKTGAEINEPVNTATPSEEDIPTKKARK